MRYTNDVFFSSDDELVNRIVDKYCGNDRSKKVVEDVKLNRPYGKQVGHMYRRGLGATGLWDGADKFEVAAGKVYLGEEGLDNSWQLPFKKLEKCKKCGSDSRPMFVYYEDQNDNIFVCSLRDNGGEGDYWPHDMIACCVYLCKDCFEPSVVLNQG